MSCTFLNDLNKKLATRSYLKGYSCSEEDKTTLCKLTGIPDAGAWPHVNRWAHHIVACMGGSRNVKFTTGACPSGAESSSAAKPAAAAADDMDDMFGDDDEDEEETAADKARAARMAHALKLKQEADAKKASAPKKEKPVEKSLVVLEVKPWEADTDLKAVWELIVAKEIEGLKWGEKFELQPVAFGIMKLVMTCSIVDSIVLMDDVTEHIESFEEFVQSCQMVSMNKIS
jgi:elongation factor 1-beta